MTPACVGLGRDCAEKEVAVASCNTGPDSSCSARVPVMIAEKGARGEIDKIEQRGEWVDCSAVHGRVKIAA